MKMLKRDFIGLLVLIILVVSACGVQDSDSYTQQIPGLPSTLAVQTMAAQPYMFQLLNSPTPIPPTPTLIPDSQSLIPTFTPLPENTEIPQLTSIVFSSESQRCLNIAEFVKDVSIPDQSLMKPQQSFTKIWRILNTGSCTWTPEYSLVHVWGHQMNGMSPKPLSLTVLPGEMIDLKIDLIAPNSYDYFQGNWMIEDFDGNRFGTGYQGLEQFWVSIYVKPPGGLLIKNPFDRFSDRGEGRCGGGG